MIFLYGPPASGKLTVARIVGEKLGFRVLHNHVTIDAVTAVLDFGSPGFHRIVHQLRLDLIAAANEQGIDLVVTFVFSVGEEDAVSAFVAPYEDRVTFVQLLASRDELRRRIGSESRRAHGKLTDVATLDALLEEYDCYTPIAGRESHTLDMNVLSPEEAADRIVELVT
jgi:cytidylate kinase